MAQVSEEAEPFQGRHCSLSALICIERSAMMGMSSLWCSIPGSVRNGILSGLAAVVFTAFLELVLSKEDVSRLRSTPAGRELYRSCIYSNIRNNLVLGPITYWLTIEYICRPGPLTVSEQVQSIFGIVLVEGILFYLVHKAFHEVKCLYWMHRYHHRFNTIVLPSSANAVSIAEYVFAYMIPIVAGVYLMGADEASTFLGAAVIAVTNLLIHTPQLEDYVWFWAFVSTHDHLEHHRKLRGNYGAPVFHVDRIVRRLSTGSFHDESFNGDGTKLK